MLSTPNRAAGLLALLTVARRNIGRNRRRTVLCVSAVSIAVFFNIFMQAWIEGMTGTIEEVVRTYETGHLAASSDLYEKDREYLPVQYPVAEGRSAAALVREIEALPGVKAVLPRVMTYASLFDSTVKHAFLWGIDVEKELRVNVFNLTKRSDGLLEGRYPAKGANECAIGSALARRTGLGLGDELPLKTVSAQFSDKYWSPKIVGIFEFDYRRFDEDVAIVSLERLARILVLDDAAQRLMIYLERGGEAAGYKDAVAGILGPGNTVKVWTDNYWVAILRRMSFLYDVVFGVFQVVASFLIINTVLMVIHERIKEIGMMGALGMTRSEIVAVFFLEAVYLSLLGAAAGVVAGGIATYAGSLFPLDLELFTGGGMKEMPMSDTIFIVFSPRILGRGFLFGVVVSALCTLVPSLKSAFVEPVEALRR